MIFFVPAREKSRRLPQKNIYPLAGKPLILWTFDSLKTFNADVLVSTDDYSIIEEARKLKFKTDIRQPHLCQPQTTMLEVLNYYIPWFEGHNEVCVLYPTNPMRTRYHIQEAITRWKTAGNQDRTLMSVSPVKHRPFGLMDIQDDRLRCLHPDGEKYYQEQITPPLFRANGSIYIIPVRMIQEGRINSQLFCKDTIPFVMNEIDGHEIDTINDIPLAEQILKERQSFIHTVRKPNDCDN